MKNRKKRRSVALHVEQLEGRLVPSTIVPPPTPPPPYALWGSTNWSGITLDTAQQAVTAVNGSWVVPSVTGRGFGYSSAWVGIDGDPSNTVEQIGTESDTALTGLYDGTPQYYAWFEMYPAYSYYIPAAVQPGDQMSASVVYAGQTTSGSSINDNFTLSISDSRNSISQWTFTTTQSLANNQVAQRNSAEWIQEAPSSYNGVLPLANFGSITFTHASATIGANTGTIGSFVGQSSIINYGTQSAPQEINLVDMGTFNRNGQFTSIKDETSRLSSSGDSFTVQYGANNPAPPSSTPLASVLTSTSTTPPSPTGGRHINRGPNDGTTGAADGNFASILGGTVPQNGSFFGTSSVAVAQDFYLTGNIKPPPANSVAGMFVATAPTPIHAGPGLAGWATFDVFANGAGLGIGKASSAVAIDGPLSTAVTPTITLPAVVRMSWNSGGSTPAASGKVIDSSAPSTPYAIELPAEKAGMGIALLTATLFGWNTPVRNDPTAILRTQQKRYRF